MGRQRRQDETGAGGPGLKWTNHRRLGDVRSRLGVLSSDCWSISEGSLRLPARTAGRGLRVFRRTA